MKRQAVAVLVIFIVGASLMSNSARGSDFDSQFAGESAFLTLGPGQTGSFTVFFQNTGAISWVRGSATQVDLAACRSDQVTCDSREPMITLFDPGTWLSPTRYATHSQTTVAPGAIATFTYAMKVPAGQPAARYRFHGDLVVSVTGQRIHPEGYYQDVTVPSASCTPGIVTLSPSFVGVQVGRDNVLTATVTCRDGVTRATNVPITVTVPSENVAGNPTLTLSATTDTSGVATVRWSRSNPTTERVTATPAGSTSVTGSATVRWIVPDVVIACSPTEAVSVGPSTQRVYSVTVKQPTTGAAHSGTIPVTVVAALTPPASVTINNVSAVDRTPGSAIVTLTVTAGSASFVVIGTRGSIRPRVYLDENASGYLETTEFNADCGEITYTTP